MSSSIITKIAGASVLLVTALSSWCTLTLTVKYIDKSKEEIEEVSESTKQDEL